MRDAIKPIETVYAGCRFRSRLEARWATFFDALGIKWVYEPEGFELADGTRYLPDFHLHGFDNKQRGLWVEVKHEGGDFHKALRFCRAADFNILLAEGPPRGGPLFAAFGGDTIDGLDFPEGPEPIEVAFHAEYLPGGSHAHEYRLYVCPDDPVRDFSTPRVADAVVRALSARFEVGWSV